MKDLVNGLKGNYDMSFGFLFKQIEVSTDAVWAAKSGKIPFWQHIYHAFSCVDFFVSPPGTVGDIGPGTADMTIFKVYPETPISKEAVREYGLKMKAKADSWIEGLEDADLAKKHEGNSARLSREMSNAAVLSMLTGHSFYHVGCNDSILRANGYEGVF